MTEINLNQLCERCQSEPASIQCQSCQPFHLFCQRCDSLIHSMKLKSNHQREPIYLKYLRPLSSNIPIINQNYATAKFYNPHTENRSYRVVTPKKPSLHESRSAPRNIQRINEINTNSNCNKNSFINQTFQETPESYGKDYLNEINRIHDKEKAALLYKIDMLENNIERLKLNFQNETKTMEERINNVFNEKKNIEEKLNQLLDVTIKEKDNQINLLLKENDLIKNKNKNLENIVNEKDKNTDRNILEYNTEIEKLKTQIANMTKENTDLHKTHMDKVSEIVKNNDDNMKNLTEQHKKEISEIYFDGKFKNEKLIEQVENDFNTIELLKKDNENLQQIIKKLEHDNHVMMHDNQIFASKFNELTKNLEDSQFLNDSLKKSNDKLTNENNNMKNEIEYFEKTINALKNQVLLLNETYSKKDKDFNYLLEQSEKIRKDFSNNMFNNEKLDLKIRELQKENEQLKKTISQLNEMNYSNNNGCCHFSQSSNNNINTNSFNGYSKRSFTNNYMSGSVAYY